jgi:hypothetical protein
LKFVKGDFMAGVGEEEVEVPLGTRFVAMMPTMLNGWIKWSDGHPVAHEMGLVIEGFQAPKRDTLGDNDKALWEEDRDPWQPSNYVVMFDAETKEMFSFATGSKGGRSALGELALRFFQNTKMSPTQVPVVEIGATAYKHQVYGKVHTPVFKVVEWVEQADYLSLLTAAGDEEEPESTKVTIKKSAPRRIAVKPAVAAKANKANKKNNGKRPVRFA